MLLCRGGGEREREIGIILREGAHISLKFAAFPQKGRRYPTRALPSISDQEKKERRDIAGLFIITVAKRG